MVVVVVVVVVVQQGTIIANTTEEQSEQQQAVRYARARYMNNLRLRSICLAVIKQTHISSSSPSTTHHHYYYHHESQGHWVREQQICAPRHSTVCVCVCAALVDPRTKLTYLPGGGGVRTHKEKARAQDNQAAPTRAQQRAATTNSGGATRATAEEKRRDKRGERRKVSLSQTEPLYRERANNRNALSRYPRLPRPLTLVRFSTSSWLSYAAIECVLVVDLASRVVSFVSRSPSLVALLLPACLRVSLSPFLCVCTYVRSLLARCLAWCGVWCERTPNLDPSTSTSTLPLVCRVLARARCCCWD